MLRLVLACLAICLSYNIALAKYCVKLPSCEDLGYVFPYKEGRRQIRCPFDTDKALYLDYCQAYGIQGKPDEKAGEYQECIEEKADGTKINTGYYRYTRCNVGYRYESGHCVRYSCNAPHTCLVGDVYLYDNEPIGVVYFDDGTTTKIVALNDIDENGEESSATGIYWSTSSSGTNSYDVTGLTNISSESSAIADMDGKSNTSAILSYIASKGYIAQATTATSLYVPSACKGTGVFCDVGNWYLPALGELYTVYNNLSNIQNSISKAGGTQISTSDFYWSSTEYYSVQTWTLPFYSGARHTHNKYNSLYVRPVLAF